MFSMKRILTPTDFSASSLSALKLAAELAAAARASLVVLTVIPRNTRPTVVPITQAVHLPEVADDNALTEARLTQATEQLRELVYAHVPEAVLTDTIVKQGVPADEIMRTAREETADVIVIPTNGQAEWFNTRFGHVSERIIKHAPCPVLTVTGDAMLMA